MLKSRNTEKELSALSDVSGSLAKPVLSTPDTELAAGDRFRVDVFNGMVDCLIVKLRKRMSEYSAVHRLFGFLEEFESLTPED